MGGRQKSSTTPTHMDTVKTDPQTTHLIHSSTTNPASPLTRSPPQRNQKLLLRLLTRIVPLPPGTPPRVRQQKRTHGPRGPHEQQQQPPMIEANVSRPLSDLVSTLLQQHNNILLLYDHQSRIFYAINNLQ